MSAINTNVKVQIHMIYKKQMYVCSVCWTWNITFIFRRCLLNYVEVELYNLILKPVSKMGVEFYDPHTLELHNLGKLVSCFSYSVPWVTWQWIKRKPALRKNIIEIISTWFSGSYCLSSNFINFVPFWTENEIKCLTISIVYIHSRYKTTVSKTAFFRQKCVVVFTKKISIQVEKMRLFSAI
jgi:hypothetical protein